METVMPKTALDATFSGREYIRRLRRDPRLRAMREGWVAQATAEAEQRYPDPRDDRRRANFAATRAIDLAMSFVLDNDGEYQMVCEQRDKVLEATLQFARMSPADPVIIKTNPATE